MMPAPLTQQQDAVGGQRRLSDDSAQKKPRRVRKQDPTGSKPAQTTSCDACRSRKVKCSRNVPLPEGLDVKAPGVYIPPCNHCSSLGCPCKYDYVVKKRGPPNQYMKRLQEEQQAAEAAAATGLESFGRAGSGSGTHTREEPPTSGSGAESSVSPGTNVDGTSTFAPLPPLKTVEGAGSEDGFDLQKEPWFSQPPANAPPIFSTDASGSYPFGNQLSIGFGGITLPPIDPSPPISPFAIASPSRPTYQHRNSSLSTAYEMAARPTLPSLRSNELDSPVAQHTDLVTSTAQRSSPSGLTQFVQSYQPGTADERSVAHWLEATSLSAPAAEPGPLAQVTLEAAISDVGSQPSLYSDGTPRRHKIDDVLSRDVAVYIISLFFDFVWVLTPCLHKQTFLSDLSARREERDPLFFALVMSTLASTLLQVPKVQIPVPAQNVRSLAAKCFRASRNVSQHFYDPPCFEMVIIRYFDCVYQFVAGNPGANTTSFAEALEIAMQLGLNNESNYSGLDPIETQLRRRILFLLFVADKSMACLLGRLISLPKGDIVGVGLPMEVDDDCLTRDRVLPQPLDRTPLIIGFNLNVRTFALLGAVIEAQREVRKLSKPIEPTIIVQRMQDVGLMFQTASNILSEAPPAFRPHMSFDSAMNSPAADWSEDARAQISDYFSNPNPTSKTRNEAKDAFLVSQGNIYCTLHWTRHVIVQYREELLELSGPSGSPARTATECMTREIEGSLDTREAIAIDLLNTLHSIPIIALAVNGPSIVQKTRFVAATFLDEADVAETDEVRARISGFLFDFLSVLSEIEKNFAE